VRKAVVEGRKRGEERNQSEKLHPNFECPHGEEENKTTTTEGKRGRVCWLKKFRMPASGESLSDLSLHGKGPIEGGARLKEKEEEPVNISRRKRVLTGRGQKDQERGRTEKVEVKK